MTNKTTDATELQSREERMRQAIEAVEAIMPDSAIVIIVMPFGEVPGRRADYISNGQRDDIRVSLKEILARWEGRYQRAPRRDN